MTVRLGQQASRGFQPRYWSEIRRDLGQLADTNPGYDYLIEIVNSVIASGLADSLAATTSMHDLLVAARPVMEPPFDIVAVRSPRSTGLVPDGQVLIEHLTPTGHDERVIRPTADAVPLFWRFMIEKYGVIPSTQ